MYAIDLIKARKYVRKLKYLPQVALSRKGLRLAGSSVLKLTLFGAFFCLVSSFALSAEDFRFKYQAGDSYRILSTVRQDVYLNGDWVSKGDQLNRILIQVVKLEGKKAFHHIEYHNSRESPDEEGAFSYDRSYTSEFWRDDLGYYTIDPAFFVPVVQDVPVFPGKDVKVGDTWANTGLEVLDFRPQVEKPLRSTMPVMYRYEGPVEREGRKLELFLVDYTIWHSFKSEDSGYGFVRSLGGYSHQKIYWDPEGGRPVYYEENYSIQMNLNSGDVYEFTGTADARVIENKDYSRQKTREDLQKNLDTLNLPKVQLQETDEGLSITLEDLQFLPDSATLAPGELDKLHKIADILNTLPDRDLLITGHTALAGTKAGRQRLSEERAQSVAQYLLDQGVRSRDQIMYQGKGADEPVADNRTAEGMAQNRRVEILILDK